MFRCVVGCCTAGMRPDRCPPSTLCCAPRSPTLGPRCPCCCCCRNFDDQPHLQLLKEMLTQVGGVAGYALFKIQPPHKHTRPSHPTIHMLTLLCPPLLLPAPRRPPHHSCRCLPPPSATPAPSPSSTTCSPSQSQMAASGCATTRCGCSGASLALSWVQQRAACFRRGCLIGERPAGCCTDPPLPCIPADYAIVACPHMCGCCCCVLQVLPDPDKKKATAESASLVEVSGGCGMRAGAVHHQHRATWRAC